MAKWYNRIIADPDDLTPLLDCMDYFEKEYEAARTEVKIIGSLVQNSAELPGITEYRFSQLQELEAIYELLNIKLRKIKSASFKKYLEGYAKALSSRDALAYSEADDEVVQMSMLINQFKLLRDQYMGILKGLEIKHWQIRNITNLKVAGLEDEFIKFS